MNLYKSPDIRDLTSADRNKNLTPSIDTIDIIDLVQSIRPWYQPFIRERRTTVQKIKLIPI